MKPEKKPWQFFHFVGNSYEIAREDDYARGCICVAHCEDDANLLVNALNFYEKENANAR